MSPIHQHHLKTEREEEKPMYLGRQPGITKSKIKTATQQYTQFISRLHVHHKHITTTATTIQVQ